MIPGEFAAIEARASVLSPSDLLWLHRYQGGILHQKCQCGWEGPDHSEHLLSRLAHHGHLADDRLLAAVRERDNTIARVRDIIESVHQSDDLDPDGYQVAGLIRAALDPQETE